MDFDTYFEKLLKFYNTYSLKGLSEATGIPITTISSIKQRKSISALKKKCMELNIYNDIFGDFNSNITQAQTIKINNILLEQAKEKAFQYGLNINTYLEFLIVQDLKSNNS